MKDILKKKKESGDQRVLHAAEIVFARNGYDGSTIDEIAKEANMNKMLIYYHFKSKKEILHKLVEKNIKESNEEISKFFDNIHEFNDDIARELLDKMLDFCENRKNIIKIISIEAMKYGRDDKTFFDLIDTLVVNMSVNLKKFDKIVLTDQKSNLKRYFTGFLPITLFFTLGEKWSEFYDYGYK